MMVEQLPFDPLVTSCRIVESPRCPYRPEAPGERAETPPASAYTPAINGEERLVPPTWNQPERPWYLTVS
jgi:hypothetical protein